MVTHYTVAQLTFPLIILRPQRRVEHSWVLRRASEQQPS